MKKAGVITVVDNVKKLTKALKTVAEFDLLVGIPEEKTDRRNKEENGNLAINNATIGYINEFGSDLNNIPERPHIRKGIKDSADQINEQFEKAMLAAFEGKPIAPFINRAGLAVTAKIKLIINNQDGFKHPSFYTILERKRNGFSGESALIVTGQYRNSITYVTRGL